MNNPSCASSATSGKRCGRCRRRPLAVRTRRLTRRVSADCFVDIDTIRYSVPHRHVRETVEVVVGLEQVEVWLRGTCIASHARAFEPQTWVRDPAHFQGLYRSEPSPAATLAGGLCLCRQARWLGRCRFTPRSWKEAGHEHGLDPVEERVDERLEAFHLPHLRETLAGGAFGGGQGGVDLPGIPRSRVAARGRLQARQAGADGASDRRIFRVSGPWRGSTFASSLRWTNV